MEQWQVQRTDGVCFGTEKKIEPGDEYYAALIDGEKGFERRDYSCQFWNENHPEVFCFWKTKIPLRKPKQKLLVDDAVLINIFHRLEGEEDQTKINFRFVLALILMRKRILKYEDSYRNEENKEIWKMKMVKDPNLHEIINPQLTDEQIESVSQDLGTILSGDIQ
ncbi:MAG: hypothetical protein JEZ07_16740 [Phycisphaerae bacterium]|nr:hypothetical protein [Phycisphaerae bacterium]